jgi:hypothetical protein
MTRQRGATLCPNFDRLLFADWVNMAPDNGQKRFAQARQGIDGGRLALVPENTSFGCALHNLNAAILGLSSVENFACVRIYEFPQTQC